MDIKINNNWSISGEAYNWTVCHWYEGRPNKEGVSKKQKKEYHYSSLTHALKVICERSMQGCETAEEFLDRLDLLGKQILETLKEQNFKEVV